MKKYIDYMKEIGADDLYTALLGYGLFPDKLPPFLTSSRFCEYSKTITHAFPDSPTQYIYYENMRNINIPRQLGIPNPFSYQRLCKCIADNWDKIKDYFEKCTNNQEYKVSRIHIRKMKGKSSLFEMNYSNWKVDGAPEPDLLIGMRYIVKADISKCFQSIYTHALTWALIGKEAAKTNRYGNWYNDIDKFSQNIKDGETHGLLIGPHASNILSEIVLCQIDNNMIAKGWKYIRNIDDYTCYVSSEEDAQMFLTDLQSELRAFDLTLNHKKTEIQRLPMAAVEKWIRKINSLQLLTAYQMIDFKNCRAYLDNVLEISQKENENNSILKYAIKVLSGYKLTENAKRYEEKTIFHLCLIYPYLIPLLEEYVFKPCETSIEDITFLSQKIYEKGLEINNFEMSSYALYYAIKYGFVICNVNEEQVIEKNDCVLLLLTYIFAKRNKNKGMLSKLKNHAKNLALNISDFEKNWLFVYEVLPKNELQDEWKSLKNKGISFVSNTF